MHKNPADITSLRAIASRWQPNKFDPSVKKELPHGWLIPALLEFDRIAWQRWDYWATLRNAGHLPPDFPIPEINFESESNARNNCAQKHLEQCLDLIPNEGRGGWAGWTSWINVEFFLDWTLYGFGYHAQTTLPEEPRGCKGASDRLFQYFNLGLFVAFPYDYWGVLLATNKFGKRQGFYPTPMDVCKVMVALTFTDRDDKDYRSCSTYDPCVGTGRLLLLASNYSLVLYAQDINAIVIKATLFNSYLYAPWIVKPLPFLCRDLCDTMELKQGDSIEVPEVISKRMISASALRPDVLTYLDGATVDRERLWRFTPVIKLAKPLNPKIVVQKTLPTPQGFGKQQAHPQITIGKPLPMLPSSPPR